MSSRDQQQSSATGPADQAAGHPARRPPDANGRQSTGMNARQPAGTNARQPARTHAGGSAGSSAGRAAGTGEDEVDRIVAQWARERPELATEAMAVFGRIYRIARLVGDAQEAVY